MPVSIVVGGQYGSEGKGKVVALLANRLAAPWIVRCGGPNSGHTVTIGGKDTILRQVPCCSEPDRATFCISAGCVVDESILVAELNTLGIDRAKVIVDPRAVIVTDLDRDEERRELGNIGSTCSGTGAALIRRMSRRPDVRLACDSAPINARCRVETVAPLLHQVIDTGGHVIVEGTQGFALSLLHGVDYPFVTSRDTTAAGFAMEVGLSPRLIDEIVMVVRTFPIRVSGTSGPFSNETTWEQIGQLSGSPQTIPEYTSVTKRLRRVAHFDRDAVKRACEYNRPTALAVMGIDRLDYKNFCAPNWDALTEQARRFVLTVEEATGVPVSIIGTGFGTFDAICLGEHSDIPTSTTREATYA
jgi:adenylosuccinate synthase